MIKDSGYRTLFETGAVRDIQEGKGRCDLLPLDVITEFFKNELGVDSSATMIFGYIYSFGETGEVRYLYNVLSAASHEAGIFLSCADMFLKVSTHFEEGAKKYGEWNWQKGIPVRRYIDSAIRHYLKYLRHDNDEMHDLAFCWNIICAIWTCKNKPELNDYTREVGVDDQA